LFSFFISLLALFFFSPIQGGRILCERKGDNIGKRHRERAKPWHLHKSHGFQKSREMRVEGREEELAKKKVPDRKDLVPESAWCKPESRQGTAALASQ